MRGAFHLGKWYFDCVSPRGDCVIAYRARLRYGAVKLAYASLITRAHDDERSQSRSTLRSTPLPRTSAGAVSWAAPSIGLAATFRGTLADVERVLYETDQGRVMYACVLSRATADVHVGNRQPITGDGYVEHVSITVAPWSLPIDELRWGRFIGRTSSLMWIDWRGQHRRGFDDRARARAARRGGRRNRAVGSSRRHSELVSRPDPPFGRTQVARARRSAPPSRRRGPRLGDPRGRPT